MPLDLNATRRLAYIRYLHQVALQQARLPEPLSSTSILMLHDAVESFLLLAAEHFGVTPPREFEKYWEAFKPHLPAGTGLASQQGMRRLNKIRVNLKHHGAHPDVSTIEQAVADTSTFMAANTQLVFGADYESLSMASVVVQDPVRDLLLKAESASGNGDRILAMARLTDAFEELFKQHNPGDRMRRYDASPLALMEKVHFPLNAGAIARLLNPGSHGLNARDCQTLGEQIEALTWTVEQLAPVARVTALGLSFAAYQRFRLLTPRVLGFMNGRREYRAPEGYQPSSEEYAFCLQFVVLAAMRLAELDASLTAPAWMPDTDHWGRQPWAIAVEEQR
ncbi:hypothetical protein [Plantactinospora sonchi]|uniref:Uncharacterized protein n=1 Tax=Plantactinospora sonchi TaxID=1544735 RepID=A0ABU7RXM6_9ACTN